MSGDTSRQDAINAAERLTETLADLKDSLDRVTRYGRRTRKLVVGTIVSVCADLILTTVAAVAIGLAVHAITAENSLHASQISACQVGNGLRAKNVQLWVHFAAISKPPAHSTPAEIKAYRARVASVLGYVRKTFPQLNCVKLYRP